MTAQTILEVSRLSVTKARIIVLTVILELDRPFTISFVLQKNTGYNRITIYRILKVFLNKEIIQIIPSEDNRIIYEIKKTTVTRGKKLTYSHAHFICNNCKSSFRLETESLTKIHIPIGYETESIEIVINGRCNNCT